MSVAFDPSAGATGFVEAMEGLPDIDEDDEEVEEEDEEAKVSEHDDADAKSCASSWCPANLPIMWPSGKKKAPSCKICGVKASAPTNLAPSSRVQSGGLVPWREYYKVRDDMGNIIGRYPKGSICSLSDMMFYALAYHVKFGTKKALMLGVAQKKKEHVEAHQQLLQAQKEWIKKQLEDPDHCTFRSKTKAKDIEKELVVRNSQIGRFRAPKKQFVLTDDWDTEEDGVFDKAKEVEEVVFGALRKGCWVLKGKKGHYDYDSFDQTAVEDIAREECGTGSIVEAAIETKREAIQDARASVEAGRDAVTVVAPLRNACDILSLAALSVGASTGKRKADNDAETICYGGGGPGETEEEDEGSEQEDEDSDEEPAPRLGNYFAKAKTSPASHKKPVSGPAPKGPQLAKPKAGRVAKQASSPATMAPATKAPAAKGNVSANRGATRGAASPATVDADESAFSLDGRVMRMQASIVAATNVAKEAMERVVFDEELQGSALVGASLAAFQTAARDKCKTLAKAKAEIAVMLRRVDISKSSKSLEREVSALKAVSDDIQSLTQFCQLAQGKSSDLDAWELSYAAVTKMGHAVSLPYVLCVLDAKMEKRVLFHEYSTAFGMFLRGAKEATMLLEKSCEDAVRIYAENACERIVTNRLVKFGKAPGKELKETLELLNVLCEYARKPEFVAPVVDSRLRVLLPLIDCRATSYKLLHEQLAYVDTYRELPNEQQTDGGWLDLFCKSPSPHYTYACSVYQERRGEAESETVVEDISAGYGGDLEAQFEENPRAVLDGVLATETKAIEALQKKAEHPLSPAQKETLLACLTLGREKVRRAVDSRICKAIVSLADMANEAVVNRGFSLLDGAGLEGALSPGVLSFSIVWPGVLCYRCFMWYGLGCFMVSRLKFYIMYYVQSFK